MTGVANSPDEATVASLERFTLGLRARKKGTATVLRSGVLATRFQRKTPDLNTFAPSPSDIQGTRPTRALPEIPGTIRGREPVPFFRSRAQTKRRGAQWAEAADNLDARDENVHDPTPDRIFSGIAMPGPGESRAWRTSPQLPRQPPEVLRRPGQSKGQFPSWRVTLPRSKLDSTDENMIGAREPLNSVDSPRHTSSEPGTPGGCPGTRSASPSEVGTRSLINKSPRLWSSGRNTPI